MNISDYVERHIDWSSKTFGPGARNAGLSDHVMKELLEIKADVVVGNPTAAEWVDVVILALDGLWRSLVYEQGLSERYAATKAEEMLYEKLLNNKARKWPDWRTVDHGKAIEHIRD